MKNWGKRALQTYSTIVPIPYLPDFQNSAVTGLEAWKKNKLTWTRCKSLVQVPQHSSLPHSRNELYHWPDFTFPTKHLEAVSCFQNCLHLQIYICHILSESHVHKPDWGTFLAVTYLWTWLYEFQYVGLLVMLAFPSIALTKQQPSPVTWCAARRMLHSPHASCRRSSEAAFSRRMCGEASWNAPQFNSSMAETLPIPTGPAKSFLPDFAS